MKDCLFCKIASGEIPAENIYEDEKISAFLDINPSAPGHTMVIPKRHYPNIKELPESLTGDLFVAVKRVAQMLEKALETSHFTIGFNNGRLSGQEIDHIHVHLIPRFENDGGGSLQSLVHNSPEESLEEVRKKILEANG